MQLWRGIIEGCKADDAMQLAHNNLPAFYHSQMWRVMWPKDVTQEFMTEQLTKRMAHHVLLPNRDIRRHQKAVDAETHQVVGYARWRLPTSGATTSGGMPCWPDAQVPIVEFEQANAFEEMAKTSWWEPIDMDDVDGPIYAARDRLLGENPILASGDYMELEYLAVNPSNKGKGVATALVEAGMQQARELGINIFVQSFPAARGLYLRLGFTEVGYASQDASKYGCTEEYGFSYLAYEVPKEG